MKQPNNLTYNRSNNDFLESQVLRHCLRSTMERYRSNGWSGNGLWAAGWPAGTLQMSRTPLAWD